MKKLVVVSAVFIRGVMVAVEDELTVVENPNIKEGEINKLEASELLRRGVLQEVEDVEDDETTKPLEQMTKAELLEYTESIGVEADNSMTKAEIIEAISGEDE